MQHEPLSCCRKRGPALITNAKLKAKGTSLTLPLPGSEGKAIVPGPNTRLVCPPRHQQKLHFSALILCPSSQIYQLTTFFLANIGLEPKFAHQKVQIRMTGFCYKWGFKCATVTTLVIQNWTQEHLYHVKEAMNSNCKLFTMKKKKRIIPLPLWQT